MKCITPSQNCSYRSNLTVKGRKSRVKERKIGKLHISQDLSGHLAFNKKENVCQHFCIQDTLSSRAALGLPLGRVRCASKGILHTTKISDIESLN